MKKIFAILTIFLICTIGKTATDSNNIIVPDSNNTAVPDINTTADCQERIKKLEENIKTHLKRFVKLNSEYNKIEGQLDKQIRENIKLQDRITKLKGRIGDSLPFTEEETPLTAVKAYPEKYTATDSNNIIVPDSNITAVPDTNTTADCQGRIKKLEEDIKTHLERFDKRNREYNEIKNGMNKLKKQNEQLQDRITKLKERIGDSLPFTGEETPLTAVKAYPEIYVGKTFIVIGGIGVRDTYWCNYEEAQRTHVSLYFAELRPDKSETPEDMYLYVRKEISVGLVEEITKTIHSGNFWGKIIRVKVFIRNHYDPSCGIQAELINWQFLSADKVGREWQDWQIPH